MVAPAATAAQFSLYQISCCWPFGLPIFCATACLYVLVPSLTAVTVGTVEAALLISIATTTKSPAAIAAVVVIVMLDETPVLTLAPSCSGAPGNGGASVEEFAATVRPLCTVKVLVPAPDPSAPLSSSLPS